MPRGGARPGAGRRPGSKNKTNAAIAQAASAEGISPIEVMLNAMREFWSRGTPDDTLAAVQIAEKAAPYCHPRLAAVQQDVKHTAKDDQPLLPEYTEEEIIARLMAKRQDRERKVRKAY